MATNAAYEALSVMLLNWATGDLDAASIAETERLFPGFQSRGLDATQKGQLHVAKIMGLLTPEQIAAVERNLSSGDDCCWVWKGEDDHIKALTDWAQLDPVSRLGTVPDESVMHDGLAIGMLVAMLRQAAAESDDGGKK